VLYVDFYDVGARWASVAPPYEALHHLFAAFYDGLDVAVGHVADPALEVELIG